MEYKINSSKFWINLKTVYNHNANWHLADKKIQKITKEKLGLKFIETCYSDEIDRPYDSIFLFEIVDQDKFLWAKIKYGI
jgi:hypothetical protein